MAAPAVPAFDMEGFLAEEQSKELLRFTTAGSVDDGKSTLIGRLLYDSKNVYEDQIRAVKKASANRSAGDLDLSLLTDGLRAEREQGITIDVAYRYFATARRKFIIADTPGHEQYTRNMATGASTADLAIILIDARNGVQPQSRRHAFIASLLGIPRLAIAINKMDLVDYSEDVFLGIEREFREVLDRLDFESAWFAPVSAREGDNVARRSRRMPWYREPCLLEYLETVPLISPSGGGALRFPVQYVIRPNQEFRGYAGQITAGSVRPGDPVKAWPSGQLSRVKSIETFDGLLEEAAAPRSVTLTLEDELDISRGDLLAGSGDPPHVARAFTAKLVWLDPDPLAPARRYLLKQTTQTVPAWVRAVGARLNLETLDYEPAETLGLNDIGRVEIEATRPLFFDAYARSRAGGSAILIDPETNATVGALMLEEPLAHGFRTSAPVTSADRIARFGHGPAAVAIGPRGAVARKLERQLFEQGANVATLAEWGEGSCAIVERAGLLAIVAADETYGLPSPGDLPENDEDAAAMALAWLAESGILSNPGAWSDGAGI